MLFGEARGVQLSERKGGGRKGGREGDGKRRQESAAICLHITDEEIKIKEVKAKDK